MAYYFETTISICYCTNLPNNIDNRDDEGGHQYIAGRCNENAQKKFVKFIERSPTCFEQFVWYLKCCPYKNRLHQVKNNTVHVMYK